MRITLKYITAHLNKNLRKKILQGDPWVYQNAMSVSGSPNKASLCQLRDNKKVFLAWGIYSPQSVLGFRALSLEKRPPDADYYSGVFKLAWEKRSHLRNDNNNTYRLFNGEGDLLPGLVVDIYESVAVMQFDGLDCHDFWDQEKIAEALLSHKEIKTVYFKPRYNMKLGPKIWGEALPENGHIIVKEQGCQFYVDIVEGQKTGFFLDQRENREYIKNISKDKSVINLFSYSGGFSIGAGVGGAKEVISVDVAQGALDLAEKNWKLNGLSETHSVNCVDVFEWLPQYKNKHDIVICDPPSLAKSEKHKEQAIKKYIETFSAAAKCVKENGHLVLSSCSSHISFNDFEEIASAALSKARLRGQILKVSGQGVDHPYPHACPHLRYLKFMDIVVYK